MESLNERFTTGKSMHIVIRAMSLLTAGDFAVAMFYKPYFNLVGHGLTGRLLTGWDMVSSALLVAVVIILAALPGNRFEALPGDRKGQFSIRINDQWRICFRWPDRSTGPTDVEIVDYH